MITQSISDLSKSDVRRRQEVIDWVGSKDFVLVCNLALVNPEDVQLRFKEFLNKNCLYSYYNLIIVIIIIIYLLLLY